ISSIAGNAAGNGVDLSDPCLSVSFGTPVMWLAMPAGNLIATSPVCAGENTSITFVLTGSGPFDVIYTAGPDTLALSGINPGHTIVATPAVTTTYTLLNVALSSLAGCATQP